MQQHIRINQLLTTVFCVLIYANVFITNWMCTFDHLLGIPHFETSHNYSEHTVDSHDNHTGTDEHASDHHALEDKHASPEKHSHSGTSPCHDNSGDNEEDDLCCKKIFAAFCTTSPVPDSPVLNLHLWNVHFTSNFPVNHYFTIDNNRLFHCHSPPFLRLIPGDLYIYFHSFLI